MPGALKQLLLELWHYTAELYCTARLEKPYPVPPHLNSRVHLINRPSDWYFVLVRTHAHDFISCSVHKYCNFLGILAHSDLAYTGKHSVCRLLPNLFLMNWVFIIPKIYINIINFSLHFLRIEFISVYPLLSIEHAGRTYWPPGGLNEKQQAQAQLVAFSLLWPALLPPLPCFPVGPIPPISVLSHAFYAQQRKQSKQNLALAPSPSRCPDSPGDGVQVASTCWGCCAILAPRVG